VLDVQQLYTVTKESFAIELDAFPSDAIKGCHIHFKHRVPSSSNVIPWKQAFAKIAEAKNNVIINPEVHHKNKVKTAIEFCEGMLRR